MSVKNYGNNIVLNKINTSATLLDYKYTVSSLIFFLHSHVKNHHSFAALDRYHIAHLTIVDVNLN